MLVVKSWCPLLLLAVAGAACHTRPPASAPSRTMPIASAVPARPPAPAPPVPPAAGARPAAAAPLTEAELFRRKSLGELNAEHPLDDAFFDYDQNTLREDARRSRRGEARAYAPGTTAPARHRTAG